MPTSHKNDGPDKRSSDNEKEASRFSPAQSVHRLLRIAGASMYSSEMLQSGQASDGNRSYMKSIVESKLFNVVISLVIIANGIQIGVETDLRDEVNWKPIEVTFLAVYIAELALRFGADGLDCFSNRWFLFDLMVVIISSLDALGLVGLLGGNVAVLRIMRLVKLTRIVRLVRFLKELVELISSMTAALRTVCWMWILLFFLIYVFSILFVNEIGHQYPDDEDVQMRWGTILESCFTLFAILTLDGWVDTARHIWPLSSFMFLLILFYIALTTYAIVNAVVAVIVQHVVEEAVYKQDDIMKRQEKELKSHIGALVQNFRQFDVDRDEKLSEAEFEVAFADQSFRRQLRRMEIDDDNMQSIFTEIDVNKTGALSVDEFVQGILQMRGNAKARRLFELHCDVSKIQNAVQHLSAEMKEMRVGNKSQKEGDDTCRPKLVHKGTGFVSANELPGSEDEEKDEEEADIQENQMALSSDNGLEDLRTFVSQGFHELHKAIEDLRSTMNARPPSMWLTEPAQRQPCMIFAEPPQSSRAPSDTQSARDPSLCSSFCSPLRSAPNQQAAAQISGSSRQLPICAPPLRCPAQPIDDVREAPTHRVQTIAPEQTFDNLRVTVNQRFHALQWSLEELRVQLSDLGPQEREAWAGSAIPLPGAAALCDPMVSKVNMQKEQQGISSLKMQRVKQPGISVAHGSC